MDTTPVDVLHRLTDEIVTTLSDDLLGLYAYGSLVTGDFAAERSDLDLLAVLRADPTTNTAGVLRRLHQRVAEEHPAWADRIEVEYLSVQALTDFRGCARSGRVKTLSQRPDQQMVIRNGPKSSLCSGSESGSSAEGAVDDDFSQSGLQNGEFLIVEPLDEQFRHTAKMDRHSFAHTCDTGVGQGHNHATPVLSGGRSTYQTVIDQPRDAAGQPRA